MAIIYGSLNHTTSGRRKSTTRRSASRKAQFAPVTEGFSKPEPFRRDAAAPQYKSNVPTTVNPNATAKKEANEYTGDYIVGVATMHKSNLVPVTREQDAKDYSTMRRN